MTRNEIKEEVESSVKDMTRWIKDMYTEDPKVFYVGLSFHASQDTPSAKGAAVEKFLKYEWDSFGLITSKPTDTAAADRNVNWHDYQCKGYTVKEGSSPEATKVQCSTMVLKHKRSEPAIDFSDVLNKEFFRKKSGRINGGRIEKFLVEKYHRPADVLQMIDENTKKGSIYVFAFEPLFQHVVKYKQDGLDPRIYHLFDKNDREIISTGPNTTNANCWYRGVWMNYQFIKENIKPVVDNLEYDVYDVYEMFKKSVSAA